MALLVPAVPDSAPQVTVEVHINPHPDRSDSVRVHYQEEHWLEEPDLRDITIDVSRDGQGTKNLYRREGGGVRQPAG